MILRGASDSPDIPLNVSRSYLQVDKNVRQLGAHISKKISDRLVSLYKTDREKYIAAWPDVEMIVKLGLLQDEKFNERIQEALIWKNSEEQWTNVADYLERNKEKTDSKIFYSTEDRTAMLPFFKEKKIEILFANSPIDTAVMNSLESKLSAKFQRLDGAIDSALLDPTREKSLLDAEGKTEGGKIADAIRTLLDQEGLEVEAKSLASDQIPALIVLDEDSRRMRDYLALTQGKAAPEFPAKKTFVVNTNSKLIQIIARMQAKQPELSKELAQQVFDLSLLAQKELNPAAIEQTAARQTQLLEKLASLIG
jgi:molecular chaperone HtpG